MRCLITGGLGFVGSWVTRHLSRAGHKVVVLSRGAARPDLGAPYALLSLDLTAPRAELAAALAPLAAQGLDGVVHLASANDATGSDYGRAALAANALGTRNLLEALADAADAAKTPPPAVIYGSTFHVYGRAEGEVSEETPPAPRNEYALTHLMGEEYCRFFARTAGLGALSLRLTNGYGAPLTRPFGKWHLLLPDLCRMALREKRIRLRSNPGIRRDFVWLGDAAAVCERLLALAARRGGVFPDGAGQILNLASGMAPSIGEIAALVARVHEQRYGRPVPVIHETPETALPPLTVRTDKLRALLDGHVFSDRAEREADGIFAALEREQRFPL